MLSLKAVAYSGLSCEPVTNICGMRKMFSSNTAVASLPMVYDSSIFLKFHLFYYYHCPLEPCIEIPTISLK